ncbi:MAG: 50S ribosomal protein L35 [Candidatus Gracilibacteria bacterium]
MKLKSHSASKKRFKVTGTGKLMANKAGKKHLLFNKSKRQKRLNKGGVSLFAADEANMKKRLPYA